MSLKANTKGWSKEALSYLRNASSGDAVAQYEIGLRLLRGEGVPENEKSAIDWLIKSSKQGNEDAEYLLGTCYMSGTGVKENEQVALGFFMKSANAANKYAQMALGDHYFSQEKFSTAMEWYLKSARQNHPPAQFALGRGYYYGFGNVKSEMQAIEWLERGASFGNKQCYELLKKIQDL